MEERQYTVDGDGNSGRENYKPPPSADASTMDERALGTPYWVAEDKVTSSGRTILGVGRGEVGTLSRVMKWRNILCGGDATSSSNFLW